MKLLNLKRLFKNLTLTIIILSLVGFIFSYKLLEIPGELASDEAAFGYNAVLLAETLHDQNGRFLPVFVLSLYGTEWRQPIPQYYITLLFKIFGASVFNLRFSSVLITIVSAVLIFYLVQQLLGRTAAFLASFLFLTTPQILIQSHLAFDNITPVPFTILWLLGLFYFHKTGNLKLLLLAGVILGINFYTYKGMRAIVPIWCILTVIYLRLDFRNSIVNFFRRVAFFALGVLPFFAVIPLLEIKYAGAVFDRYQFSWHSIYSFLYPYFSSFDPTFLFIKGDELLVHSTGKHGMMLLASLPLFIFGCYQAVKKRGLWLLIFAAFFLTPFLFGLVGSVHRASRLMAIIPLYSLLATLGGVWLWQTKAKNIFIGTKALLVGIIILMVINYSDFINYYWFTYPKFLHVDKKVTLVNSYKALSEYAKGFRLKPYLDTELNDGDSGLFFEAIYFDQPIGRWEDKKDIPPPASLILSHRKEIPGFERLNVDLPYHYLQVYQKPQ